MLRLRRSAYAKWCSDRAQVDDHQQETINASIASTNSAIEFPEALDAGIASTNATIEKIAAKAENAIADISSLTSWIASADWELTAVSVVREKGGEELQRI